VGDTHEFKIKVKNNTSDTCTVSIDKSAIGYVSSWVSIEDTLELPPSQSQNFNIKLVVPANATEGTYSMNFVFNAYAKGSSNNNPFDTDAQWLIVDNSPPEAPTFSIGQKTSTTLSITSWSSWDLISNEYSLQSDKTDRGIKEYKIFIETPGGNVVKNVTKKPSEGTSHKFKNLTPNNKYNVCVKATDLVGYSTTTKKLETMPPAKPTNLSFSNITYIDATLLWSASAGATGYDVYEVSGSSNLKKNSSPIIGNSYKIENLEPNSKYSYNVIALSDVGPSDRSDNAPITTIALPPIIGPSTVCSGTHTFKVKNLISGYSVSWSTSSRLTMQYASESSAYFSKKWDGSGWIGASITAPNEIVLELEKKEVWVGSPIIDASEMIFTNTFGDSEYLCTSHYDNEVNWSYSYPYDYWDVRVSNSNGTQVLYTQRLYHGTSANLDYTSLDQGFYLVGVRGSNECGIGAWNDTEVMWTDCSQNEGGGIYSLELTPNPVTNETEIKVFRNDGKTIEDKIRWEIEVYDLGMNIKSKSKKLYGNKHKLKARSWEKGIYIVRAYIGDEIIIKKLMKK
jgi:hypothetical protein